ncbi:MAG: CocE/NonD family hydrolase, partial [Actinomycetota bacterium]|nr:CocE/NonD family hydrolase [Actinomycetota bacterium]
AADFDVMSARYIVPTRHGDVHLTVSHPARDGTIVSGPVVLTYTPYDVDGSSIGTDLFPAASHVPDGYVRAYADVIGTGNSGGCWDYGGTKEQQSAYDVVEWIAKQKWSTGKVAMIGGSYEGTTANMAAVARPPHLTTIIPVAAISRWYGYAYAGGVRYSYTNEYLGNEGPTAATDEGFDTPLLFDFGFAMPPPLDPTGEDWAARVQSRINPCDRIEHTERGYDDTPDYDGFWKQRDYLKDASKVTIPVLVGHNWGDWNVKQDEGWEFFKALKNSKQAVMFFGSRWAKHGAPGAATTSATAPEESKAARAVFDKTVKRWFDHYLLGKDNGIDDLPSVISQTADSDGIGKLLYGKPKTTNVDLIAQANPIVQPGGYGWTISPNKPSTFFFGAAPEAKFLSGNVNTESHAAHHSRANHDWFWFESPMLKKDVRVFGEIKVQIYSKIEREWVTLTPSIIDHDPADHIIQAGQHVGCKETPCMVAVTRGFLDSRYRDSLSKQKLNDPMKYFEATVEAHPVDYIFKKGHHIGLNIQTEILEWMLPKPYPGCDAAPDPTTRSGCSYMDIAWQEGRTRLIVPIVDAPKNPMSLFAFGHAH